jgi:hypothetical protein
MKDFQDLNETLSQDEPRTWKEYFSDLFGVDIKLFHPFNFLFHKHPKMDADWDTSDDLYQYGFSLDLTTEMYYYTYDWGKGFNFRLLGFGLEIAKIGR